METRCKWQSRYRATIYEDGEQVGLGTTVQVNNTTRTFDFDSTFIPGCVCVCKALLVRSEAVKTFEGSFTVINTKHGMSVTGCRNCSHLV